MEELRKLLEKYMNQDLERLILSSPRKGREEQKVRIQSKGPDECRPLPHTAGQFGRSGISKLIKSIIPKQLFYMLQILFCHPVLDFQPENYIFIDGAPFKKMIFLKHITDTLAAHGSRSSMDGDGTAFWFYQRGNHGQKRGFSAAAGTDNGEKLSFRHGKGNI